MLKIAELYQKEICSNYFGSAKVIKINDEKGVACVQITTHKEEYEVMARVTTDFIDALGEDDEVLVAGDISNDVFVIGMLTSANNYRKKSEPEKIEMKNGAYATIGESSENPVLKLFSKRNELLVEYDPVLEKTRINVDIGNLEFTTHEGDIVFNSANNIQLNGQTVEIKGKSSIDMSVIDTIGQLASTFSLRSRKAKLCSPNITVTAQKGDFVIKKTRYISTVFRGKVEDSRLIVGKLSTIAKTISENAKNVYKTCEQLTQLKTGRMRTLVTSTFHMKSKNTIMKSEEDFKVNAEKIHLG